MEKETFMTVLYTVIITLCVVSVTAFVVDATSDEVYNQNVVNFELPDEPQYPPDRVPDYPPNPPEPDNPPLPNYPTPRY